MKAFVVSLNGEPFITAGIGDDGVLTTRVTWVGGAHPPGGTLSLHVGGLDSRTKEHVRWEVPEIGVGDEITIKLVETERVTPEEFRGAKEELERRAAEGLERLAAEEEESEGPDQDEA